MIDGLEAADRELVERLSGIEFPFFEGSMSSITGLGSFYVAAILLVTAWSLGATDLVIRAAAGLAGAWLVVYSMKYVVARERPAESHRSSVGYSFPSGHSATAFLLATVFARVLPLGYWLFLLAAAVATSRIYFRLHYPSDALAGSLIGVSAGYIVLFI